MFYVCWGHAGVCGDRRGTSARIMMMTVETMRMITIMTITDAEHRPTAECRAHAYLPQPLAQESANPTDPNDIV